jgi:hypothetical protein
MTFFVLPAQLPLYEIGNPILLTPFEKGAEVLRESVSSEDATGY